MSFSWQGERVRLAPLERERHFENYVRWVNDPLVTQWTLIGDFPLTRLAEADFFERMARSDERAADVGFAIELLDPEEHIGGTALHNISYRHGTALTGMLIGRTSLWGRGLATEAMRLRTGYAFEVLGLRLLLSEALADNIGSLRALAKAGYHEVGRIPQRYWKRGAYRDAVLLALPRDHWRP